MSGEARLLDFPAREQEFPSVHRVRRNEARQFALEVVRDPAYRRNFRARALSGKLAPALEITLLAYAWGKPPQRLEIGLPGDFEDRLDEMTPDQLAARARLLAAALEGQEDAVQELVSDRAAVEAAVDSTFHEPEL